MSPADTPTRPSPRGGPTALRREEPSGGFHGVAVIAVAVAAAILFVVALYAMLGERVAPKRFDDGVPTADGVTAVDLGALAALAEATGRNVRRDAAADGWALDGAVVIVSDLSSAARLETLRWRYDRAAALVMILPKWRITELAFGRRFAEEVRLQPIAETNAALERVIEAFDAALSANGTPADPDADIADVVARGGSDRPFTPALSPLDAAPTISTPQLGRVSRMRPIVSDDAGRTLIGELAFPEDGLPRVYVLFDPDPFLNHGLDDDENAVFAFRVFDFIAAPGAPLSFDGGPAAAPSPASFWAAMFEPPLVAVSIGVGVLFIVVALLAVSRFGGARPDRPGQAAGKTLLLDAAAALLRQGDGDRAVIGRFFDDALRDAAATLRAPSGLDRAGLIDWFEDVERRRGAAASVRALAARVEACATGKRPTSDRLTSLARDVARWRGEMIRGH